MNLDLSFIDWQLIQSFVLKGFFFSIQLTLVAMIGGIVLGTVLALMRLSSMPWLVYPAAFYVNTLRAIPLVMVILWFFLLIPLLIGTAQRRGLGDHHLQAVRGGVLLRDHARRHPERAQGAGLRRLRGGDDLRPPPGIPGYLEGEAGINPYGYDWVDGAAKRKSLDYARQLLAEAGYPKGRDARTGEPLKIFIDVQSQVITNTQMNWMDRIFDELGVQETQAIGYLSCVEPFFRVKGHMPHPEKGGDSDAATDEDTVSFPRQETIAETPLGTADGYGVPYLEPTQSAGVVPCHLDPEFDLISEIIAAGDRIWSSLIFLVFLKALLYLRLNRT